MSQSIEAQVKISPYSLDFPDLPPSNGHEEQASIGVMFL